MVERRHRGHGADAQHADLPDEHGRAVGGHPGLLDVQRTAGNRAVADLLGARLAVQRTAISVDGNEVPGTQAQDTSIFNAYRIGPGSTVDVHTKLVAAFQALAPAPGSWDGQRLADLIADGPSRVIAGHGRFNDKNLKQVGLATGGDQDGGARRSKRLKTAPQVEFTVPQGMKLTMYAPPGAALENTVGNQIERGNVPDMNDLELKLESKILPLPAPFPRTYSSGEKVYDFTVSGPDKLKVEGSSYVVAAPTLLSQVVEDLQADGYTSLHYACCSTGHSEKASVSFEYKGYYVRYTDAAYQRIFGTATP